MSEAIPELIALIRAHRQRLEAIYRSMESALDGEIVQLGKTPMSALIVAGLLENYYTCLETIYLRISQSFENKLDPARCHNRSAAEGDSGDRRCQDGGGVGGSVLPALRVAEVPALQTLLPRAGIRVGSPGLPGDEALPSPSSGHTGSGAVRAFRERIGSTLSAKHRAMEPGLPG